MDVFVTDVWIKSELSFWVLFNCLISICSIFNVDSTALFFFLWAIIPVNHLKVPGPIFFFEKSMCVAIFLDPHFVFLSVLVSWILYSQWKKRKDMLETESTHSTIRQKIYVSKTTHCTFVFDGMTAKEGFFFRGNVNVESIMCRRGRICQWTELSTFGLHEAALKDATGSHWL